KRQEDGAPPEPTPHRIAHSRPLGPGRPVADFHLRQGRPREARPAGRPRRAVRADRRPDAVRGEAALAGREEDRPAPGPGAMAGAGPPTPDPPRGGGIAL